MNPFRRGMGHSRPRAAAIVIALTAFLCLGSGTSAGVAAEPPTAVKVQVPSGASEVWIDIESAALTQQNTSARFKNGGAWQEVPLRSTAFGVSAVLAASPGEFELQVTATEEADADVSLSFAGADRALLLASGERLRIRAAAEPIPSPSPTTAAPSPTEASPSPTTAAPSPTEASPSATSVAAPSGSPSASPGQTPPPSASGTAAAIPAQTLSASSAGAPLAETGWQSGMLLWISAGLLLVGAAAIAVARHRKGRHS
ncbi:MAG: hypothetical protein ABWY04_16640 [Arthrobacter sp.]